MGVVWANGVLSTRDVYQALLQRRNIAYTTVMTVMGNLTRKGLLRRHKEGRAYLYQATVTQDELTHSHVAEVVGHLLDRFAGPVISYLIGRLDTLDASRLEELEAEVTRLRRRSADDSTTAG